METPVKLTERVSDKLLWFDTLQIIKKLVLPI